MGVTASWGVTALLRATTRLLHNHRLSRLGDICLLTSLAIQICGLRGFTTMRAELWDTFVGLMERSQEKSLTPAIKSGI
jgi:hypothetical protein